MDAVYSWCNGAKFSDICKVRLLPFSLRSLVLLTLASRR